MIADELREKILEVEKQPESRLRTMRLHALHVLLDRFTETAD